MLAIQNERLTLTDGEIKSSDTVLELQTELDCEIFGRLSFRNGDEKIIQFNKIGNVYKGRLVLTQEDLPKLVGTQFFINLVSAGFNKQTNAVQFKFNTELIKKDIRLIKNEEIKNLMLEVSKLRSEVASLEKRGAFKISVVNADVIKPGMIPIAIDSQGNFIGAYPFANTIVEVNGQKSVDGVVKINSTMIKCNSGKDVQTTLDNHANALQSIASAIKVLSDQQKDIISRLDEMDIKLSQHINDGII